MQLDLVLYSETSLNIFALTHYESYVIRFENCIRSRKEYVVSSFYGEDVYVEFLSYVDLGNAFAKPGFRYYHLVDRVVVVELDEIEDAGRSVLGGNSESHLLFRINNFVGTVTAEEFHLNVVCRS